MPSNVCLPGPLSYPMSGLDDLFSGDDELAQAALERLSESDRPELSAALRQGDAAARAWAAAGLGRLTDPASGQALLTAAADPDPDVRAAVLFACGQRRLAAAVTPLLFALADPSAYLARLATDALVQVGPAAVPDLCEALGREVEPRVRVNLARALALIGDTRSIPALFRALDDDSALVQHWAEDGLERMGVGQVYFRP